jgi:hypothetical protein
MYMQRKYTYVREHTHTHTHTHTQTHTPTAITLETRRLSSLIKTSTN